MQAKRSPQMRGFRGLVIATLVILGVQGWFGDFVTVFVSPASGITPPLATAGGLLHALQSLPTPLFPLWHAFEGLLLVLLSITVAVLAFSWAHVRGVRIFAVLGLLSVLLAAAGGFLFVLSGFAAGGNSMQMGGSFILAFASYFLVLYFTK